MKKVKANFLFCLIILFVCFINNVISSVKDTSVAKKQFIKGCNFFSNSQFDSSLVYFNLAQANFKKNNEWLFYIQCLINSGRIQISLHNIEKANELFELADKIAIKEIYSNSRILKHEVIYLKYSLAITRDQYDKIILYGDQYLKQKSTKYNVASVYYTLGYSYFFLQDYERSNEAYFNAIKEFSKNNKVSFLSNIYSAIATNYYLLNEYDNSILYNNKAKGILFELSNNHPDLVRIYITLSMIYFTKNDFSESIVFLNQALRNQNNKTQLSCIFRSFGRSFEKMNDFKKAEEFYTKALDYAKSDIKKIEEINILFFYGDLCKKKGNRSKTLNLFNKALFLSLNEIGLKNSLTSKCYTFIADFYKEEKNYQKSFQNYQLALISLNPLFYSMDIYSNPSIVKILSYSQYFIVLKSKADLFREYYQVSHKQKDLDMSLDTYELLCREMERQRSGFMMKEDKAYITEKYYSIYSTALQTAMQLYKLTNNPKYKERALKLAEQNKSAFLLEEFNESDAKKFAGVPQEIREKEKTIRQKIAYSEKMIYDESQKKNCNPKTREYWESCLFEARKANDTLALYIKNNYGSYYRLKYDPSSISSKEIQKNLSSDAALIEYSIADTVLYIFVITKDRFEIIEQKSIDNNDMDLFYQCFSTSEISRGNTKSFNKFVDASYNIYAELIKPIEPFIESKNELIIIPDDKLSLIPFESLITTKKISGVSYKNLSYMIKKYSIGYTQLATLLINKKSIFNSDYPDLLAIASEYGTRLFKDQSGGKQHEQDVYNLDPIQGAYEELEYLQKIDRVKIISSDKATEGTFKKIQRRYNILHLAMHAFADSKNPMYSKLFFSESTETGEDGVLSLYELMNMDIGANLAVLSACNTGSGNFQKGEGIMNLARGFFYAGCQSVIMTLWAVDDNSSSELIKGFYNYFTKGKTKTEALRLAKLDFLEHASNVKAHPYFWAGYVNIGDPSALYPDRNKRILLIVSVVLVLLISILIIVRKRQERKKRIKRQLFRIIKSC